MAQQALINHEILPWARDRAGLGLSVLAKKLNVSEERLASWEDGEARPTFKQAQKLSEKLYIPFGYLFLATPPEEEVPIPDLRTLDSSQPRSISLELRDTIQTCLTRVQWYKEYLNEQGVDENPYVGRAQGIKDARSIVKDMKTSLGLPIRPLRGNAENYLRDLTRAIENIGILVMSNGVVGNNTHRPLSVEEFRGFAISDAQAPLIFINGKDGSQPKLFTLIHELAHIWIGSTGISNGTLKAHVKSEQLCNQVAGEFLVPEQEFFEQWDSNVNFIENTAKLASYFKVSHWVVARRALTFALISQQDYERYIQDLKDEYAKREGRGDFWKTQRSRLSVRFAQAVTSEALSGRMLLRDASNLLDISPNQIKRVYKEVIV
ncbi:XRE family transcriptional regulator [Thiomicrorhabdus sp. ZW0627]|uniref:XRE family transcriptional regulator n=1 Tax=Thiomicrorhabdus sp. ZW0627 TaxID=3039774 RepID=UPI00243663BA|nr:XRE family transcriptional regulator [Thiomicrorhabdus sp. ZW0627]MDG6774156.1 XRE family transcriptional regulator [Thiomicrorhabdus sp. ZW0627]